MDNGTHAHAPSPGNRDRDPNAATRRDELTSTPLEQDVPPSDSSSSGEAMRFPWSSPPSGPTRPTAPSPPPSARPASHKRTVSGSILSRLNFLRAPTEDGLSTSKDIGSVTPKSAGSANSRKSIDDDEPVVSPTSPNEEPPMATAMTTALKAAKTRKRKGSLRKTALLGGKRIIPDGRERRSSFLQRSPSSKQPPVQQSELGESPSLPLATHRSELNALMISTDGQEQAPLGRGQFRSDTISSNPNENWSGSVASPSSPNRLSLLTGHDAHGRSNRVLSSPHGVKSPGSVASYTSTDDDDILTFTRPSALQKPLSSAATAYFPGPSEASLPIRAHSSGTSLSKHHTHSPLAHTISSAASSLYPSDPELGHDYTETEYWGWVILFVTWLTFTIGMGSCLELWSWAWDVGETPYAPPELEDDPTLPIVGYYPALIVLTGVVAWVWITVAWVGMKYFRHAKIEV